MLGLEAVSETARTCRPVARETHVIFYSDPAGLDTVAVRAEGTAPAPASRALLSGDAARAPHRHTLMLFPCD